MISLFLDKRQKAKAVPLNGEGRTKKKEIGYLLSSSFIILNPLMYCVSNTRIKKNPSISQNH